MAPRTLTQILPALPVNMGPIELLQPIPSNRADRIGPFLLLHHFGPIQHEPGRNPMDVGAHPHRGFEPVSFVFQGELYHKDSRGNKGKVGPGGVQWMTAGMGIVHSESASKEVIESGGVLEGIQLWINLPAKDKMVQPAYSNWKPHDLPVIGGAGWTGLLTAGQLIVFENEEFDFEGPQKLHHDVMAATLDVQSKATVSLGIKEEHDILLYLLDGGVVVPSEEGEKVISGPNMLHFGPGNEEFQFRATQATRALLLSGAPLDEPVATHGPFVMNTQTQIMEAMRDYQMGKMGVLTD